MITVVLVGVLNVSDALTGARRAVAASLGVSEYMERVPLLKPWRLDMTAD